MLCDAITQVYGYRYCSLGNIQQLDPVSTLLVPTSQKYCKSAERGLSSIKMVTALHQASGSLIITSWSLHRRLEI